MVRPNLRARVPDAITARLPGGGSDDGGPATGGPIDDDGDSDSDGSDSPRWPTLLALAGLGLAALGVVLDYVLDRRGDDGSDDEPDRAAPAVDPAAAGTVEIVGDRESETDADDTVTDGTDADLTDVTGSDDEAESSEPIDFVEESADDPGDAGDDVTTGAAGDVTVETFESDRPATRESGGERETEARDGPPRIAPLVGMVALVGIRLFTERVR